MRKLKTPIVIINQVRAMSSHHSIGIGVSHEIHVEVVFDMIKAAQRDALECLSENVANKHLQKHSQNDSFGVCDVYSEVNNLIPKP